MSSIEKMSLSGVRSFSQDSQQVIDFFKPLTIIVGHNGAGKTTIIESLKYASTGLLPPNSAQGKTFVHDPKLDDETEMNAQIKMKFKSTGGFNIVATRQMKVIEKKKTSSFRGGDGVLQSWNANKEKLTITNRVADMDKRIPELMGVSKAILENVIFCHQEDANWPLSDAKTLKGKFDEIFAATRYTKALEAMRKSKSEKTSDMKNIDVELKSYKSQADAAQEIRHKLREVEQKIEINQKKREELNAIIDTTRTALNKCGAATKSVSTLQQQLEWEETQCKEKKEEFQRAEAAVKASVSEEDKQIQVRWENIKGDPNALDKFRTFIGQLEAKRESVEANACNTTEEVSAKNEIIARLDQEKTSLADERAKLKAQVLAYKEKLKAYEESVKKISQSNRLERPGMISRASIKNFKSQMDRALEEKGDDYEKWKRTQTNKLDEEQKMLQEAEASRKQIDENIKSKNIDVAEAQEKVKTLEEQLEDMRSSGSEDLETAKEQFEKAKKDFASFEAKLQTTKEQASKDKIQEKISEKKTEIQEMNAKRDYLAEEIRQKSKAKAMQEIKKKEVESNRTKVSDLMTNNKPLMNELLGTSTFEENSNGAKNLQRKIRELLKNVEDEKEQKVSEHKDKERQHMQLSTQLEADKKGLDELECDLKSKVAKLKASKVENEGHGFAAAWERQKRETDEQMQEDGKTKPADILRVLRLYERAITKNHNCPLCGTTGLESEQMIHFAKQVKIWEERVQSGEAEQLESQQQTLAALKDTADAADAISGKVIKMKKENAQLAKKAADLKKLLPPLEHQIEEIREKEQNALKLRSEAEKMEEHCKAIDGVTSFLENHIGDSVKLLRVEEQEMDATKKKCEELSNELGELEKTMHQNNEKHNRLANVLQAKQTALTKKEVTYTEFKQISLRINDVANRIESDRQKVQDLQYKQLPEKKKQLEDLREKFNLSKTSFEDADTTKTEALNDIRADARKCRDMDTELSKYTENPEEDVKKCEEETEAKAQQINQLRQEVNKLRTQQDKINEQKAKAANLLGAAEKVLRKLEAELELDKKRQLIDEMQKQLAKAVEELGDLGDYESLKREHDQANADFHMREGELKECENSRKSHQDMLRHKTYRDVETRVREKNNEAKTTKMAIQDLDKFHSALDRALMKYHSMKMEEINKTMSDLWQSTYQGQDIEKIKLTHDEESATSTKRNYNYRMVMIKKGKEIDMRGRCSAGQKVLASLVLRLALAETFGTQCGVLALDEPTTNLDHANIRAFAVALCGIIRERMKQKNFQIIVITHDEEFVSVLSQYHCHADYFYRVSKDPTRHYSTIEKHELIDLDR